MYLANKSIFLMHTTSMKVVCLILIILFLVMLLLFLSPKIKVMIILSERTQSAYYLVSNKFTTLTKGKVLLLEDGSISIVDKKSVLLQKRLPKELSSILIKDFINKIKLTGVNIYISGGKKDNPFYSALLGGTADVILKILGGVLNIKRVETDLSVRTDFKDDNYTIALQSSIKISIILAVLTIIKSNIKYKKAQKEKTYAKIS